MKKTFTFLAAPTLLVSSMFAGSFATSANALGDITQPTKVASCFQANKTLDPSNKDNAQAAFDAIVADFADVADSAFVCEIAWMLHSGISTGWKEDGKPPEFKPLENTHRNAMAAFLKRLNDNTEKHNLEKPSDPVTGASLVGIAGLSLDPTQSFFSDLNEATPFYKDIQWLASHGITRGWAEDNTFRPLNPIARDAMSASFYRLAGPVMDAEFSRATGVFETTYKNNSPFVDVQTTDEHYKEMAWAYHMGITTGNIDEGNRFYEPLAPISREAIAAFTYRFNANVVPVLIKNNTNTDFDNAAKQLPDFTELAPTP